KSKGGEEISLRDLGFDDGGADCERGLAGEQRSAFRDCEKVARETEIEQVVKEACGHVTELGEGAEVLDFLRSELEVEQVVDNLRDATDQRVIPLRRQTANGELEGSRLSGF